MCRPYAQVCSGSAVTILYILHICSVQFSTNKPQVVREHLEVATWLRHAVSLKYTLYLEDFIYYLTDNFYTDHMLKW